MRERGIIMGPESVRAILAGTKTQTRRVVQYPRSTGAFCLVEMRDGGFWPHVSDDGESFIRHTGPNEGCEQPMACPYGAPGDRLFVKEAFQFVCAHDDDDTLCVAYRASQVRDDGCLMVNNIPRPAGVVAPPPSRGWRSPLFMPRWASRLTLEVTEVRVQRVQEISEDDARAEGCHWSAGAREFGQDREVPFTARDDFAAGWDAINGKRAPWSANPWVWALTFRVVAARAAEGSD